MWGTVFWFLLYFLMWVLLHLPNNNMAPNNSIIRFRQVFVCAPCINAYKKYIKGKLFSWCMRFYFFSLYTESCAKNNKLRQRTACQRAIHILYKLVKEHQPSCCQWRWTFFHNCIDILSVNSFPSACYGWWISLVYIEGWARVADIDKLNAALILGGNANYCCVNEKYGRCCMA